MLVFGICGGNWQKNLKKYLKVNVKVLKKFLNLCKYTKIQKIITENSKNDHISILKEIYRCAKIKL